MAEIEANDILEADALFLDGDKRIPSEVGVNLIPNFTFNPEDQIAPIP